MKHARKAAAAAASLLLLSACGATANGVSLGVGIGSRIGSHVGIGTSINIPIGGRNQPQPSAGSGGIQVIEQKIVTHFDAQGKASEQPVKGGYYRQLIRQDADGYLVQDFYAGGEKRTDPMTLTREQVFSFRAHPLNGSYTVYALNGTVMQQQNFRNGKAVAVGQ